MTSQNARRAAVRSRATASWSHSLRAGGRAGSRCRCISVRIPTPSSRYSSSPTARPHSFACWPRIEEQARRLRGADRRDGHSGRRPTLRHDRSSAARRTRGEHGSGPACVDALHERHDRSSKRRRAHARESVRHRFGAMVDMWGWSERDQHPVHTAVAPRARHRQRDLDGVVAGGAVRRDAVVRRGKKSGNGSPTPT